MSKRFEYTLYQEERWMENKHFYLQKCKLNPQRDNTIHLLECLKYKNKTAITKY